jgi:hypothetical protein
LKQKGKTNVSDNSFHGYDHRLLGGCPPEASQLFADPQVKFSICQSPGVAPGLFCPVFGSGLNPGYVLPPGIMN